MALRHTDLWIGHTESGGFEIEPEVLWGGHITEEERHAPGAETIYLRRFEFDRRLRRGESHSFGIRYWVERNPDPSNSIQVNMTIPAEVVGLHVNFWGTMRPAEYWRYGPIGGRELGAW